MNIDPSWNYKDFVRNLKTLRLKYEEVLSSFSYIRDENKFIYEVKKEIYSFKFDINKIDKIWEYINGDLSSLEVFIIFGIIE